MPAMTQSQVDFAYDYLAKLCAKEKRIQNPKIVIREPQKSDTKEK